MSEYKQKLRKLLSESLINRNDTDNKGLDNIIHTTRSLLHRNHSTNYFSLKKRNITLENSRSYSNLLNKSLYTKLFNIDKFKHESNSSRVSYLVRSCTLRDIHNYINSPSLSRSMSVVNIEDSDRKHYKIKKKIETAKNELSNEIIQKKVKINKPVRNLNGNLLTINKREIIGYSPINVKNSICKNKKCYINYPCKGGMSKKEKLLKDFNINPIKKTKIKKKIEYIKINL